MPRCSQCGKDFSSDVRLKAHGNVEHAPPPKAKLGSRPKFSEAADRSSGTAACPRCGGTDFTAKRSVKGKTVGFGLAGIGGLLAPKSQVKCVTCGEMFKRS
jgi:DNA-directed RNA polymerase subunit RPC12/RpoP